MGFCAYLEPVPVSAATVADLGTSPLQDQRERLAMLQALRGSPVFGRVSAHLFHDLLDGAQLRNLASGDRLGCDEAYFFAVLSGRVHIYDTNEDGTRRLVQVLNAGDTFGETHVLRGQTIEHEILAEGPARVALVPIAELRNLPGHMHQELQRTSHELEGQAHSFVLADREPTLIYVSAPEGIDGPTVDALCVLLAATIEAQFGEKAAVVVAAKKNWVLHTAGPAPTKSPKPKPTWRAAAAEQMGALDYVIVSLGQERRPHALPHVMDESLTAVHVVLTPPDVNVAEANSGREQVLKTVLLDPSASRRTRRTTLDLRGIGEGRKRSCRLLLGPGALARAVAARDVEGRQAFLREYEDTLSRWARFVTRRSVAVALGGGGAWGYFHVALLNGLLDAGVPVDVTSGTSFGALVSVYFAAEGRVGLEKLVQRGRNFGYTQALSMISTHPLELQIAQDLGGADLTRLPIAANPFTTNLTQVEGQAAWAGPAALGARASSSAPGVFGPTVLAKRGVFVDGVVAGNVPSAILISQGADLLVASNVVPRPVSKPVSSWAVGRLLSSVSPLDRVYEAYLSTMYFLYAQGLPPPGLGCLTIQGNDAIESMKPSPSPSDFSQAAKIVAHTKGHDSLQAAVEQIKGEWDRRRRPRSS